MESIYSTSILITRFLPYTSSGSDDVGTVTKTTKTFDSYSWVPTQLIYLMTYRVEFFTFLHFYLVMMT